MIYVLTLAGVSILIMIYLYMRAEGLRREIANYRRQTTQLGNEVKSMEETIEILAFEQQAELRKRIARVKGFGHPDANFIRYTEALIEGSVNVAHDSARGHKSVHDAFKRHLGKTTDICFDDFSKFLSEQDNKIKQEWHRKSVLGYLTTCRLLIDVLSGESLDGS